MYCPIKGTPGGKLGGALLVDGIEAILDVVVIEVAVEVEEIVVVPVESEAELVAEGRAEETLDVDALECSNCEE